MQCVFSMAITALDDLGTVNMFCLDQDVNVFIKHIQKDFPCKYVLSTDFHSKRDCPILVHVCHHLMSCKQQHLYALP